MVCFAEFVYNIKYEDVVLFVESAQRYFSDLEWNITLNDVTINSTDIMQTLLRMNAKVGDTIKFSTGSVWNQLSFVNSLPKVNFSSINISKEDRKIYSDLAQKIVNGYHDSGTEVAIFINVSFPWENANVIMAVVNEIMPLDGFFCSPTSKLLWIKKKDSYHIMTIQKSRDGSAEVYTNCGPQIIFDMDDGFVNGNIPIEMKVAFDQWVVGWRRGPVLSFDAQ